MPIHKRTNFDIKILLHLKYFGYNGQGNAIFNLAEKKTQNLRNLQMAFDSAGECKIKWNSEEGESYPTKVVEGKTGEESNLVIFKEKSIQN